MTSQDPRNTYLSTTEAYNLWASVYDTDGNVLQQLDDIYVDSVLPKLLSSTTTITVLDLGCGTGRNTIKLYNSGKCDTILAVDSSVKMLGKLKDRIQLPPTTRLVTFLEDLAAPFDSCLLLSGYISTRGKVSGIISTLVLEHFQLETFFSLITELLQPGGWLLLTNMHPEMGAISSAGFLDENTGKKVKPVSINHDVEEILMEAGKVGLRVSEEFGGVAEDGIRDADHAKEFGRRAEKWVGVKMHVGVVFRLDM